MVYSSEMFDEMNAGNILPMDAAQTTNKRTALILSAPMNEQRCFKRTNERAAVLLNGCLIRNQFLLELA